MNTFSRSITTQKLNYSNKKFHNFCSYYVLYKYRGYI